jgi:beta-galactosidase
VPEGVEVNPRYGPNSAVYVLVNFAKTPQTVKLPSAMTDVLNGVSVQSVTLPHYGVAVVKK